MKIDMFSHILPEPYLKKIQAIEPDARDMDARAATVCGIEFFGIDHTVFGTDAPFGPEGKWGDTRWQIEVIESLDITPERRQAIYEGNPKRLLGLGQSGDAHSDAKALKISYFAKSCLDDSEPRSFS